MKLSIVTPKTSERSIAVTKVFFPGAAGSFEVLENHAPMVAALGNGDIVWDGGSRHIRSGFVEVRDNELTAVVDE